MVNYKFNFKKPIVCTAIHNGHLLSDFVQKKIAISEQEQLREEDPFTDFFIENCGNTIIPKISRFEVDLNRPMSRAIYLKPKDCWGMNVRKREFTEKEIQILQAYYQGFYDETHKYLTKMLNQFEKIFIFDIHSYNHHRLGISAKYDDPLKNPEIILGTNNMPEKWLPLIENIQKKMTNFDFYGSSLDVRINVKFPGGHFSRWIHNNFPENACCVAIEFKKIFMDEWTGFRDIKVQEKLRNALESCFEEVYKFL
ncbi:MAG: N-formylglutamate amidohydrolase [Candidatus Cloacimonetes bacterium]|nr:N-formylglutamate amidohydrolase [Candidatus Cloacimonadota bacterium]